MGTSCPEEIYIFETTIFCTETYIKNKTITKYEIVSTETAVALSYILCFQTCLSLLNLDIRNKIKD